MRHKNDIALAATTAISKRGQVLVSSMNQTCPLILLIFDRFIYGFHRHRKLLIYRVFWWTPFCTLSNLVILTSYLSDFGIVTQWLWHRNSVTLEMQLSDLGVLTLWFSMSKPMSYDALTYGLWCLSHWVTMSKSMVCEEGSANFNLLMQTDI